MKNLMIEMKELVEELNQASKSYYSGRESYMTNKEFDEKYDRLLELELKTGVLLPDSPTQNVGYKILAELEKVRHEYPALSLEKTKSRDSLKAWLKDQKGVLSWKLDGLTGVATYVDGDLRQFVTRGDGIIGEDVTHNAPFVNGLPMHIPVQGKVIIRGEVFISYPNFKKINDSLENPDDHYKNPRNLATASLRLLNSKIASTRFMEFQAFELVIAPEMPKTITDAFIWMENNGIRVVPHLRVSAKSIIEAVALFEKSLTDGLMENPSDGLVLIYDDIAYGRSLGKTGKYPKNAIAFKWADSTKKTRLRYVEWSASRTGLINPVAIFDPIELEGTTVRRASIHNVRYMENLRLGYNDEISVYKANLIIPQIYENLTQNGNLIPVPAKCPVCGRPTERVLSVDKESEFLYCNNPNCAAKHVGRFTRMAGRDGLNIRGVSKATIATFVDCGFIKRYADIYHLDRFKDKIIDMEGMGERSFELMMTAIGLSRKTTSKQLLYALGIPHAGHDVARILSKTIGASFIDPLAELAVSDDAMSILANMEGIGIIRANSIVEWFKQNMEEYKALRNELSLDDSNEGNIRSDLTAMNHPLDGLTFVITGKLETYPNRDALKAEIEARGGKVAGSVSKSTSYLINNDLESTTGKNKKARELNIPVISEKKFKEEF